MANIGQTRPEDPSSSQEILKELQSEVSVEAAPLMQFIVKHAMLIMVSVGLFAVTLAGIAGYNWYSERQLEKLQNELATIVMISDAQTRFTELEKYSETAPKGVLLATLLELATVAISLEKYEVAINNYARIAKEDANNPLGQVAMLNQAENLLRLGQASVALDILEKLQLQITNTNKSVVLSVLAEAAILANKPERAIKAFEELAATTTGAEADFFRYRIRTLEDKQNAQKPKAKEDIKSD